MYQEREFSGLMDLFYILRDGLSEYIQTSDLIGTQDLFSTIFVNLPKRNVLAFYCYDKVPEKNSLKEERFYFSSWFHRLQFMIGWSIDFGSLVKLSIMVEEAW